VAVALGDLDADGDLDLVEVNRGQGDRVWWNDGSGTFSDSGQQIGGAATETEGVAIGDVDGDGDLDLVMAVYGGPTPTMSCWGTWMATVIWMPSSRDITAVVPRRSLKDRHPFLDRRFCGLWPVSRWGHVCRWAETMLSY